jgi:hypothetical protein
MGLVYTALERYDNALLDLCSRVVQRINDATDIGAPEQAVHSCVLGMVIGVVASFYTPASSCIVLAVSISLLGILCILAVLSDAPVYRQRTRLGANNWRVLYAGTRLAIQGLLFVWVPLSLALNIHSNIDGNVELVLLSSLVFILVCPIYILSTDKPPPQWRYAYKKA